MWKILVDVWQAIFWEPLLGKKLMFFLKKKKKLFDPLEKIHPYELHKYRIKKEKCRRNHLIVDTSRLGKERVDLKFQHVSGILEN